jgi:predicted O-linked N-acetylglucosamine transferase (SPINDLY family)
MPELIAGSLEEYEATALALMRDPARLSVLRERLAQARRDHHFFDSDRYRVRLEAAYEAMAARQAAGLPPVSFTSRSSGPTWAA